MTELRNLKVTAIGSITNNGIDSSTQSLNNVAYEHHEIHQGSHYYIEGFTTIQSGASVLIGLTTPNTSKWSHFTWGISSNGVLTSMLYEDAGISGGVAVTPLNNNRNSSNTSDITIAQGVSGTFDTAIKQVGELFSFDFEGKSNAWIVQSNGDMLMDADLNVTGDLDVTGNITGNQIYGGMWYHNHTATDLTFVVADTYYPLWFDTATDLNGFSYVGGFGESSNLTAQVSGRYQASYMGIGSGQNNHDYITTILIDGVEKPECANHHRMSDGGDVITQSGVCIITINAGQTVQVATQDMGGTGDGTYIGGNINLVRIGD